MATSAPIEQEFGGKTYKVSPMTLLDIQNVNNKMRADFITAARISNESCANSAERRDVLDAAMKQAGRLSMFTMEGLVYLASYEGTALLFFYSVKKNHPEFTLDEAFELFFMNDANKDLFDTLWGELNANKNEPVLGAKKNGPPATEQTT